MRLVFFGSSHGKPEPGRRCSSTMIEVGEARYFVDMGSQSIEELVSRGMPPESVRAVFVTHMHGDHNNGLVSFLDLCSWAYRETDPVICLPGDTEGARAALAAWLAVNGTKLRPFEFRHVEEGVVFDDGILRVTAYRTAHIDFSYAYLVEAEGKRILFSGDLSRHPAQDFPYAALLSPLDLAIVESAHFAATEYIPILGKSDRVKKLCFNHYSSRFLASVLEAKAILSETFEVLLATDGLEVLL